MKWPRLIVCTKCESPLMFPADRSLWVLPREMDWTSLEKSFDLLGTTHDWGRIKPYLQSKNRVHHHENVVSSLGYWDRLRLEDSESRSESSDPFIHHAKAGDERVKAKLTHLLRVTWQVFDFQPETVDHGIEWLGEAVVKRLLSIAQIFTLLEKREDELLSSDVLWQHSVRTGCLAGILAKEECKDSDVIMQSCVAGYSHDIGLAILALSLDPCRYVDVMLRARRESLSLSTAELLELGYSHEIVGAEYLQRQMFPQAIVDAVAYHDNPLGLAMSLFTPTIAVYAANTLDGGGWPQDSDGVPSDRAMEYLSWHGYSDPWPKWQRAVAKIQGQELGYA